MEENSRNEKRSTTATTTISSTPPDHIEKNKRAVEKKVNVFRLLLSLVPLRNYLKLHYQICEIVPLIRGVENCALGYETVTTPPAADRVPCRNLFKFFFFVWNTARSGYLRRSRRLRLLLSFLLAAGCLKKIKAWARTGPTTLFPEKKSSVRTYSGDGGQDRTVRIFSIAIMGETLKTKII